MLLLINFSDILYLVALKILFILLIFIPGYRAPPPFINPPKTPYEVI